MLILALDTTTRAGSVAVVRDTTVLSVVLGDAARTHGERLPGEFDIALQRAGVSARDIELLAVASGPGAFTGLRIGLAAIQGLAMVLNVPVVAVSALDALAFSALRGTVPLEGGQSLLMGTVPPGGGQSLLHESLRREPPPRRQVAAWMDAARGEVFAAFYAIGEDRAASTVPNPTASAVAIPEATAIVATPESVIGALPKVSGTIFIGDGAVRYAAQIQQHFGAMHLIEPPPPALATIIAILGRDAAVRGEKGAPHALQPLYVRRPDAELARGTQ